MVGIHDLARRLGISIGTVSRALNDKADVNAETRVRVLEAAAQLGYSPNQSGRSLRRGKTDLVGFVIPVSSDDALVDAVFLSVLDGLRRKISEHGLDLAIFLQEFEAESHASVRRLMERSFVDGVVIAHTLVSDPRIDYLVKSRRPFVAFGRSQSGGSHSWVDPDFEAAVEAAIGRLVSLGHARIGLIMPEGDANFLQLMMTAYEREMGKRGLSVDPGDLRRRPASEAGGHEAAGRMLASERRPTAFLASDTLQIFGLYRKLNECGLRPGRDISVVGLMTEARVQMLSPALTSYSTDWTNIGAHLGEALVAAVAAAAPLSTKAKPKPIQFVAPVVVVEGESVHEVGPAIGK